MTNEQWLVYLWSIYPARDKVSSRLARCRQGRCQRKGVMLCGKCHHEAHFGKLIKWIRQKCKEYLEGLYG